MARCLWLCIWVGCGTLPAAWDPDDKVGTDVPVDSDAAPSVEPTDASDPPGGDEPDPPEETDAPDPTPGDSRLDCGTLTLCGGDCVDLTTDLLHCGRCDRSCNFDHASGACVGGSCEMVACDGGWLDCDLAITNGCEHADTCQTGASCSTTCGSNGSWQCGDRCSPTCSPPSESCNLADDDCDGSCDEGAGCRVGIHRGYGPSEHDFSPDASQLLGWGGSIEAYDFFYLYASSASGVSPFYRCTKPNGLRFLTRSANCEGLGGATSTIGYIAAAPTCGSTPLYRLHHPVRGNHFYTHSTGERDNALVNLGFTDEGVAGHVWLAP